MSTFTILFILFTLVLYLYLFISQKELVFVAKYQSRTSIVLPIVAAGFVCWIYFQEPPTSLDELVRGVAIVATFLSYLVKNKGITEESFMIHQLDNRGINFKNVDRVVLFHDKENKQVKLNFFQFGLRGPLLKFSHPLDEIVGFLSEHLKEGTPIDVILDPNEL